MGGILHHLEVYPQFKWAAGWYYQKAIPRDYPSSFYLLRSPDIGPWDHIFKINCIAYTRWEPYTCLGK